MTDHPVPGRSVAELHERVVAAVDALAATEDPAAFQALLSVSAEVGAALGRSAQLLSGSMSWAAIGELAGTSRQNAWSRWSS